jgi:hypothetical protein
MSVCPFAVNMAANALHVLLWVAMSPTGVWPFVGADHITRAHTSFVAELRGTS